MAYEESPGSEVIFGVRGNANPWNGKAAALSTGHGIEPEGESLAVDRTLIQNMGLAGSIAMLPGQTGNLTVAGPIGPIPGYYDLSLLKFLGRVLGTAGAGTQIGAETAYTHALRMADSVLGKYLTMVLYSPTQAMVEEFPHIKLTGFDFSIEENKQGQFTFQAIGSEWNQNRAALTVADIVASATPANATLTVLANPVTPSQLRVVVTDANTSITTYVITFIGTDRDDNVITEVYTLATDGLIWVSRQYFKTVSSAVATSFTGVATSDTVTVGSANGVNSITTAAGITIPATLANPMVFSHAQVLIGTQGGGTLAASTLSNVGAVTANDEVFPSKISVKFNRPMEAKVTTRGRYVVDEPAGNGFVETTLGLGFPAWDATNNAEVIKALRAKSQSRVKIILTGPLCGTASPYSIVIWLQGVQWSKGKPSTSGPGRRALDLEGSASRVLTAGTGFPDTKPIAIDAVISVATDSLTNA